MAAVVAVGHCRLATKDLLVLVNESSSQNGKGAHAEHAARWRLLLDPSFSLGSTSSRGAWGKFTEY
jgi:hypothetical protein